MTNFQPSENDPFLNRDVLPTNVKPLNYKLHIWPNLETFKFNGHVETRLLVQKDSKEIAMNAVELEFKNVKVEVDGKTFVPVSQNVDAKKETATFTFAEEFKAGSNINLIIDYVGVHNDKLAGFYRSNYEDVATKEKKYMVVTQFEPTDARKALPCWDEPSLKATFDVTLSVKEHLVALSNMNDIETSVKDGIKTVKFATTPLMSTYLLAFVVGELGMIESKSAENVAVRVFAPKGLEHQGKFAMDVCAKVLDFFSEYFDIPYPLPKMDLVAIPDFGAGAMENWGLVTYRTVYLLFDEKSSALKSRERIAYVVGHELAHQWFGNLVSPEWWADLWLNEGFATWAGWLATDKLFPEWNVWTSFVSNDLQRGLSLDALVSSHPIEVPVKNPHEIHQIFDAISYSKGASVIRMLASYMGAEDFRQGVNNYLKKFKFSNARTQDLWHYLEAAAHGKPIAKLMHSWTRLTGYPVVTVDSESGTALKVKQDRFLSSGAASFDQNKVNWFVPLQIITDAQPQPGKEVLDEKQATIALEKASKEFFKLNHNHTGFFRTFYKEKDLENIGKNIKKLSTSDRIGLVSDLFALSQAGYGSSVSLLKLLDHHYRDEDNYIVWSEIATSIANLKSLFRENEQVYSKLKKLSRNLFSPIVERLGWEFADEKTEGYLKQLLRTLAISVAGKADDEKVVMEAKRRFELFVGGQESALHPNIRGAVFAIVLANDDGAAYEKVVRLYKETKTVDQKLIALSSLGSAKTDELLMKTLQFGMNPDNVRPQDIIYVIGTVAANPKGCKLAWKFVKDNWQTLYDRYYTGSMSLLARVVSSTTEDFSSEEYEKDVTDFFAGKDLPAISRAIEQSLEKIRVHTQWLKRETLPVQEWASKY